MPKRPIDSMQFLLQRTHAQGAGLSKARAAKNLDEMNEHIAANKELLNSYEKKSDDNRPACLRGEKAQEYLTLLFKTQLGLNLPKPKTEVMPMHH